jgi:hypothetical protein
MFRLSDATRRLVTTGLFVLLCVVPTVVVIAIGLWRGLPGRAAAEERRLSLLLGQPVRLASVRELRPGKVLYEGLEILDPETGRILLECDQVRAEFDSVRRKGDKAGVPRLRISVDRRAVVADSLDVFRPVADRLLQRRIEGAPPLAVLTIERIVLKKLGCEFPAYAEVTLQPQESRIELRFRWKGQTKPVSLCLVRNRNCVPPVDGFQFISGDDGPIPCSVLSTILPPFPDLGPNSKFQGLINGNHVPEGCRRLDGQEYAAGWQLDVRGYLLDIDLEKLVADHLPHEISGTGSLQLEQLQIFAGRIAVMKGSLQATRGRISRDLVASCVQELGLETTFPILGPTALLIYDELAVGFHLDGAGLRLFGECHSNPEGAMLVGYAYRLDAPSRSAGPIRPTKAIAALTSTPEFQLSTSRHASALVRRVPFIPTAPTAIIAAPRGDSRTAARQ